MNNCNFKLRDDELVAVFYEVSNKNDRTISMSEFLKLISHDEENKVPLNRDVIKASQTIISSHNITILDLFQAFDRVPDTFCQSFTSEWWCKMKA